MKSLLPPTLLLTAMFAYSCSNPNSGIIGYWEATFNDSLKNPIQYLEIKKDQDKLTINSDEPGEDWYNIRCEKISFRNDSLHFERFWGLEKYDGKLLPGDSIITGIKQIHNKLPVPFTIRRVSKDEGTYKFPLTASDNLPLKKYIYKKPAQGSDDLVCSSLDDVGIDTTRIYSLVNRILTREIPNIHSLLILKDNKLVFEEYFYNYTSEKPHRIHSVTKSIASALTGIAIDKNLIPGTEEPVWKYFQEWDSTKWISQKYDIRIRHLLSMTAGLEWKSLSPDESNDDIDMYKTTDYYKFILNKSQKFTPGTNFCYNNGLSLMLGHIIENASGISIDSFSKQYLFNNLSIKNYSWDIEDNGVTRMDGGLKMRPRDMIKFGQLYLNEGEWDGKQIVSKTWIINSTSEKLSLNDRGYADHWWTKDYSINGTLFRTYFALGHGEQAIIIIPDYKLVFVMTAGNYMQVEQNPFDIMAQYILPSFKTVITGGQVSLSAFIGEFRINETESIIIEIKDSSLVATDPSGKNFKLNRKATYSFTTEDESREVQFVTDNQGTITMAEIFVKGQKVETLKKIE